MRNGKVCRVLGRYLREREREGKRERGKNPIYAIDERDTKTTE